MKVLIVNDRGVHRVPQSQVQCAFPRGQRNSLVCWLLDSIIVVSKDRLAGPLINNSCSYGCRKYPKLRPVLDCRFYDHQIITFAEIRVHKFQQFCIRNLFLMPWPLHMVIQYNLLTHVMMSQ